MGQSNHVVDAAHRGAHSRSTENYLRDRQFDRAIAEIRLWESEFPAEKLEGQLTLLYAWYWYERDLYAQAVAQAEQLLAVNGDSPYADQILMLSAQCEVKRGKNDRAVATLRSLVKDYPGSPLVPKAKARIEQLESGETPEPKKPEKPPLSRSRERGRG